MMKTEMKICLPDMMKTEMKIGLLIGLILACILNMLSVNAANIRRCGICPSSGGGGLQIVDRFINLAFRKSKRPTNQPAKSWSRDVDNL